MRYSTKTNGKLLFCLIVGVALASIAWVRGRGTWEGDNIPNSAAEAETQFKDSLNGLPADTIDAIARYIDFTVAKRVDQVIDDRADIRATCSGRLTLTTGTPVATIDATAAGTIYFTPYNGSKVSLYDGTNWKLYAFTEVSLALTATSGKNYDVFLYDNSGTLTLTLSAAWSSDTSRTARGDNLGTLNGVYVNSVTIGTVTANKARYLGTIRASAANVTEDSIAKRFVWNNYNRIQRILQVTDATDNWTYGTNTWRQARATATNQVEIVVGLREDPVLLRVIQISSPASSIGIGVNATNANSAAALPNGASNQTGVTAYTEVPRLGYTYYAWLENSSTGTTETFYGDAGDATIYATGGLFGEVKN